LRSAAFYQEVFGLPLQHQDEDTAMFRFKDTLDQHGVAVISGPEDREWGMRTMTFADPGGNTWEIAQELPKNGAS